VFRDAMRRHFTIRPREHRPAVRAPEPPVEEPVLEEQLSPGPTIPVPRVAAYQSRSAVRILDPDEPQAPPADAIVAEPEVVGDAPAPDAPPDAPTPRRASRVLGVNLVEGIAYLGVLEDGGVPRLDAPEKIVLAPDTETAEALAGFAAEVGRVLRHTAVGVVAVARPERYSNWTYADAFDRISLETCIAVEAYAQGVRYESVGQNHAANVVGLPLAQVGERLAGRLGIRRTTAWTDRWPAFLVALATRPS
jgi:hypothetical protein